MNMYRGKHGACAVIIIIIIYGVNARQSMLQRQERRCGNYPRTVDRALTFIAYTVCIGASI